MGPSMPKGWGKTMTACVLSMLGTHGTSYQKALAIVATHLGFIILTQDVTGKRRNMICRVKWIWERFTLRTMTHNNTRCTEQDCIFCITGELIRNASANNR